MGDTHVAVEGDSLWIISKQYGVSFQELKAINPEIMDRKPKDHPHHGWLYPGDVIQLPPVPKGEDETVCQITKKCPLKKELKVVAIELKTTFELCKPAMFKVTQYKGTPTEADKATIQWMIREATTQQDLKSRNNVSIEEKGEKLIIECVPFDWHELKIEIAAQLNTVPQQKMIEETPSSAEIFDWIAIIKKAEIAYPTWTGVDMTNAMRRLAGYDGNNFRKMYNGSPRGNGLRPAGALTAGDIAKLKNWTRHSVTGGVETGIVNDPVGNAVAGGHVLTGISGGVYHQRRVDITPLYSGPAGKKMDNLYAVTISGDLGQVAVFVNEDKQTKPYIGLHGDATNAEILGDLDGFNIGFKEPVGGSGKLLSDILLDYYCSCETEGNFHERVALFEKNDGGKLEDEVRRFANTYVYASEGALDGLFSSVDAEANEASAEFRAWAVSEKAAESIRAKKIEDNKEKMKQ